MFTYDFARPALTVDVVGLRIADDQLKVLLIERPNEPFAALRALPGGFVRMSEELDDAARRVLNAKAGVADIYLEQLATFGAIDRDPRERTISVSYLAVFPADRDYKGPGEWQAVSSTGQLAFDHDEILHAAVQRLRAKISYSSLGLKFLADTFTLTEAQKAQEAILGKPVDKRNFRKSMLARDLVQKTGGKSTGGAHPPAALYSVRDPKLKFW